VLELCRDAGVAVALTMAGGYARNIEDTVEIHWSSVRAAAQFHRRSASHAVAFLV